MDLSSLKTFISIADSGSFSAAAERLFLTQPAVSKRIATLEQQLDTRLFDRIGREVSLTEAGRALLPRARRILQEMDDTRRELGNLSGSVSGSLTIATSHHIGLHRLPPLLRAFSRQYPQVALDIRFLDSEVAFQEVLHGRIELALITLAPHTEVPMRAVCVWDDPLDFVCAPDHPLALLPQLTLTEVARHPAIFPEAGTFTHQIVQQLFEDAGLPLNLRMNTNYLETIKMMVSVGLAWSVLPRSLLDEQLRRLTLPGIQLQRQLGYIHHGERTLSNAAHAFMALLESASQSPPAKGAG